MSVGSYSIKVYVCTCDECGKNVEVKQTEKIYNGAQAVRSLGWKFGKDKSVKCLECRRHDWDDHYQYAGYQKANKTTS